MRTELSEELAKLRRVLASVDLELKTKARATDALIESAEHQIGLRFDEDLWSLWRY